MSKHIINAGPEFTIFSESILSFTFFRDAELVHKIIHYFEIGMIHKPIKMLYEGMHHNKITQDEVNYILAQVKSETIKYLSNYIHESAPSGFQVIVPIINNLGRLNQHWSELDPILKSLSSNSDLKPINKIL